MVRPVLLKILCDMVVELGESKPRKNWKHFLPLASFYNAGRRWEAARNNYGKKLYPAMGPESVLCKCQAGCADCCNSGTTAKATTNFSVGLKAHFTEKIHI